MKTSSNETSIHIRMIENEQIPEWIKDKTVWVETISKEITDSSECYPDQVHVNKRRW